MPKPIAAKALTAAEFAERLQHKLTTPRERSEAPRERRYQAERDLLVAVLSRIWPAHITEAAQRTLVWTDVVCIHSPAGQLAWGLPADRAQLFAHLTREACDWDGHTPSQRDARLRALLKLETLTPAPGEPPATPAPRRRRARKVNP
jgi:hypothetical protein